MTFTEYLGSVNIEDKSGHDPESLTQQRTESSSESASETQGQRTLGN